ncbi:MAG: Yip1 family protein [Pyrinomonadaceae bacterium]
MSETNSQMNYAPASEPKPDDAPTMTTPQTLTNIFFEPGSTFAALRERPRFLIAAVIMMGVFLAFTTLLLQRVNYEAMVRESIDTNPRTAEMEPEQKEQMIAVQTKPIFKSLAYVMPVVGIVVFLAAGAGLYLLGAMAMGKGMSYKQSLAVYAYSSMPPTVLLMLANIIILLVKPPDVAEAAKASRGGLIHANPGVLFDGTTQPVLATVFGSLDLFAFYGLFLAAIGLRKVARLSSGSAWTIVLALWLLGVILRVGMAALFGSPMA